MQIRFINHASFLLENAEGDGLLLTDPWYEGQVFSRGWDLLFPTKTKQNVLENVKYVWISHEHPDHFSPTTILKFFSQEPKPKFLFQKSTDGRVVRWLRDNGYEVLELIDGKKVILDSEISIFSRSIGTGDAYSIIFTNDRIIVNTNDAIFLSKHLMQLQKDLKDIPVVDLLTCQFGLAGKVGGSGLAGDEIRREASDSVVKIVMDQIRICNPKYFLPSASFKYFCRSDNQYMNHGQSTPREILNAISSLDCQPLFLIPDQSFDFANVVPDPDLLCNKFQDHLLNAKISNVDEIEFNNDLFISMAENWWRNQRDFHGFFRLFLLYILPGSRANRSLTFSVGKKQELMLLNILRRPKRIKNASRLVVEISEEVAMQAFKNDFGLMSLLISARVEGSESSIKRLRTFAFLSSRRQSELPIAFKSIMQELRSTLLFAFKQIPKR